MSDLTTESRQRPIPAPIRLNDILVFLVRHAGSGATTDERVAIESLQEGSHDYLVKAELDNHQSRACRNRPGVSRIRSGNPTSWRTLATRCTRTSGIERAGR
jgi:hypothetical protein